MANSPDLARAFSPLDRRRTLFDTEQLAKLRDEANVTGDEGRQGFAKLGPEEGKGDGARAVLGEHLIVVPALGNLTPGHDVPEPSVVMLLLAERAGVEHVPPQPGAERELPQTSLFVRLAQDGVAGALARLDSAGGDLDPGLRMTRMREEQEPGAGGHIGEGFAGRWFRGGWLETQHLDSVNDPSTGGRLPDHSPHIAFRWRATSRFAGPAHRAGHRRR